MLKIPEILKKKMINTNLALILDKYGYSRNIEEKMINMNSPLALILDKYGYWLNVETFLGKLYKYSIDIFSD